MRRDSIASGSLYKLRLCVIDLWRVCGEVEKWRTAGSHRRLRLGVWFSALAWCRLDYKLR